MGDWMSGIVSFLRAMAGKVIVPQIEKKFKQFERMCQQVRSTQHATLFRKIRHCAGSQFGRDHHFSQIKSLNDFRRQIPIATYDYYHPYVKRVTEGDIEAMFPRGEKILMYTLTSGTTDIPKLIPVTSTWFQEYRQGWMVWGVRAFTDHHPLFYSKLAGIAGNWDMRRTPTDLPCGMASGLSARLQHPLVRMMYVVPASIFEIDDVDAKYYASLRSSVPEPAGLFLTATPATVVNFAKLADRWKETLIRDIADGTISPDFAIPEPVRQEILRKQGKPRPERARELENIVEKTGRLYPKDFWNLELVACWLGGTVGTYAQHIPLYYGQVAKRDIGLLCSEGRFTIPIDDDTPAGVLEIASHYYEFIPEAEIHSPSPTILEAHELEVGQRYFILMTTASGLYRYNIVDVMRCTGFFYETPILEFLHKGQRVADMEGEKISEYQLVKGVEEIVGKLGVPIAGFTALPVRPEETSDRVASAPYYAILIEEQDLPGADQARAFLRELDRWLIERNPMYQGKRSDLYVGPPRLVRIPSGTWARFDAEQVKTRGVSEDHYKHPCLLLDDQLLAAIPRVEEITIS
jgi:hypothetical protein